MSSSDPYDVVVAGAGPVGLLLATELRLAGVRVLVVERRTDVDTASKAEGINAGAVDAFARRGLLPALQALHRPFTNDAALSATAQPRFAGHFGGIQIQADVVEGDGWEPLQVPQADVERILDRRATELGAEVRRGVGVTSFDVDDDVVTVHLSSGNGVCAGWLVGCDGGRSLVRRLAGFDVVGIDPEIAGIQAVATISGAESLPRGWQHGPAGLYVYGPAPGRVRTFEFGRPPDDRNAPVSAAELEASLRRVTGADVRVSDVKSAARVSDNARQATAYRRGRVLLCGDAAHVHPPFSGQGLNLGIGDAANLGWKLAATVRGWAPDGLLDTYATERHPIGAQVLQWTRAQVAVMRGDPASIALRQVVAALLETPDGATQYVKRASGLGQRYDVGGAHPLCGTLMPGFPSTDGRALLLDATGGDLATFAEPYADRLLHLSVGSNASCSSLIRPDGFVAWAADDAATTTRTGYGPR